ncbi:L-type lectin-domain containing receptor kinase VII.1-like [Magnolia sinica]|uniref:L-type lectin-domain containing receptor kinase VII.1-like n=1 Tax=Magnolia sinica TaxID=86752 RepID=UPI00265AD7B6|nr:L-type lectin-domain containing receptor kinase VII.1-like [Magnolia sinica]
MANLTSLHLLIFSLFLSSSSAVDFLFNGFNPSDLTLYSDAAIESGVIVLTDDTNSSTGRAVYKTKIPTKSPNYPYSPLPFSTSFVFSISPVDGYQPGHGLAFLFTPSPDTNGTTSSQHLALFNGTNDGDPNNHILAVEFDVFENPEFKDIDDNHVGIDINSLTSVASNTSGYTDPVSASFISLSLNNGENYQAWIDYADSRLNVTMAPTGLQKPDLPLISIELNLSDVLLDEMYVGFSAATGVLVESHRILAWSFSNSNFSAYEGLITSGLPSFIPGGKSILSSRGFIAGVSAAGVVLVGFGIAVPLLWIQRAKRKREKGTDGMEDWELEYWPHRMRYRDIFDATNGFSESNVIGIGGNGKVYKGVLRGQIEVAVKCIRRESGEGMKQFLAEISSLGRLKHRNLVGLRGWCRRETGDLILVYDFMENGSLDKWIFDCEEEGMMLGWDARVRVLKDVATGLLYLHEGWDVRVLHRDIKASNVMLDGDMHGQLGDFGLARMHSHERASMTTRVVGTVGYMAPEVVRGGKVSEKTDVFGFGVLVLEVVCGRRPAVDGSEPLVEWVWGLMERGELVRALDVRVRRKGVFDEEEVEMLLHLGLMCTCRDPDNRPSMRRVVSMMDGADGARESDGEGYEAYLFGKLQSMSSWSKHRSSGRRRHPTYAELRQSRSSVVSLYGSDLIAEGR